MKSVPIATDYIVDEIKTFIPHIFKFLKKKFDDFNFKTEEELGTIYHEYLEYSYKKYSMVKTLLYKNEARKLHDFYEPIKLRAAFSDDIDTTNTNKMFEKSNNIIITGTGGIGKSMLVKHVFINQVEQSSAIPVFIELKSINEFEYEGYELEDFIYNIVTNHQLNIEKEYFVETLKLGKYLLLLDGLDEVHTSKRVWLDESIKRFVDRYNGNRYIISSRPSEEFIGWNNFVEYEMQKLDKVQALSLINKLNYEPKVKRKFSKVLKDYLYDKHESFASIPLLLTIMLMTYESGASIPDNLTDFYNQAFYVLYQRHDASKSGYKRELRANLTPEEFKDVLAYIGMKTFFNGQVDFDLASLGQLFTKYNERNNTSIAGESFIYDATHNACMMIQEGVNVKFAHRSFQEYFSALGVSQQSDDIQSKLLTKWVKEDKNNIIAHKTFIDAIFSIQKNRTYNNLCVPIFEEMDSYLKKFGNIDDIIEEVFVYFQRRDRKDEQSQISFKLNRKRAYYFYFQFALFRSIGIGIEEIDNSVVSERSEKKLMSLWEEGEEKYFSDLAEEEKILIKDWVESWYIARHHYFMKWIEDFKKQAGTRKRSLKSIIDDL